MNKITIPMFVAALMTAPAFAMSVGNGDNPPDQSGFGATTGSGGIVTGNGSNDHAERNESMKRALEDAGFRNVRQISDGVFQATTEDGHTVHFSIIGD